MNRRLLGVLIAAAFLMAGCLQSRGPLALRVANQDDTPYTVHIVVLDPAGEEVYNDTVDVDPQASKSLSSFKSEGAYRVSASSQGQGTVEKTVDYSRKHGPDAISVQVFRGTIAIRTPTA